MRLFYKIALILLLAATATTTAQAQVRFGIKGGVTINELKWDKDIVSKDNRAGFTGGFMIDKIFIYIIHITFSEFNWTIY